MSGIYNDNEFISNIHTKVYTIFANILHITLNM
jgi:hypothetical protein